MTPIQLYEEIKPVLMAFQLSGLDIRDVFTGDPTIRGENAVCFTVRRQNRTPTFCIIYIAEDGVIADIVNRFRCPFSDVSRFLAEEMRKFHDS